MRVAIIVPSNLDCSPNRIVKYLCENLSESCFIKVFYLKSTKENTITFPVESELLSINNVRSLRTFHIIHSNLLKADLISSFLGWLFRTPTISTLHSQFDYDLSTYRNNKYILKFITWIWRLALNNITCLVPVSKSLGRFYEASFPLSHICPIQNGLPFKTLMKYSECITSVAEYDIGIVSRLHKGKGIEDVIQVCQMDKGISCLVVGNGGLKAELEKTSTENVEFLGYVANPISQYRRFVFFVMPSKNEGFGMTILESIAAGTPVLCFDTPVNREILGDGNFYYKNETELLDLILKHKNNHRDIFKKQSNSVSRFSAERMSESYLDLYKNHMKGELL